MGIALPDSTEPLQGSGHLLLPGWARQTQNEWREGGGSRAGANGEFSSLFSALSEWVAARPGNWGCCDPGAVGTVPVSLGSV